ncbi:tol-pal system protein YbgF [Thalassotalea sp. LPB0316]|uniref:tol-pal system protein YbgF n=1 Tax=Thalassotalea sp. LPB0316 TaxID=2769490 RepID=UPI001866A6CE|nr:tol-pal system protein YbgF [Thalassotalea sp. LPB0316]QOL24376.1 tol-pal system protein YbgF [Thalassotalea sp. LPB0316]
MNLNKIVLGVSLAVSANALAAPPAPVIDASGQSSTSSSSSYSSLSVEQRLQNLERQLSVRNKTQVMMQQQLNELQNEVNELRGVTELHSHKLNQILERQRDLYQELDKRVSAAMQPATPPAVITAPEASAPAINYSSDLTENEAYDRAVNMVLKDKRYDEAIPEFEAFNNKYPNSTYAPNAHYWLGQLLFNKGELERAKTEFSIVVNQHEGSSKRSDALLKLGMVAQKQNDNARAVVLYQQLLSEYPNSSAAQLAKPRLESLQ